MKMVRLVGLVFLMTLAAQAHAQPSYQPQGELKLNVPPGVAQMQENFIRENRRNPEMVGYRVQFYNGEKSEVLKARARFITVFPGTPVYTLYESPEYRVQGGDFRTRLEAEHFLNEVRDQYGSAFVIKTMIKLPRLEWPLEEE